MRDTRHCSHLIRPPAEEECARLPCPSFWEETVTTEWDLVCQDSSLNVLAKMIFFSGFAVGTFLAGIVSDIWGRKRWSKKLEVGCKSDPSLLTSDPSCCSPC